MGGREERTAPCAKSRSAPRDTAWAAPGSVPGPAPRGWSLGLGIGPALVSCPGFVGDRVVWIRQSGRPWDGAWVGHGAGTDGRPRDWASGRYSSAGPGLGIGPVLMVGPGMGVGWAPGARGVGGWPVPGGTWCGAWCRRSGRRLSLGVVSALRGSPEVGSCRRLRCGAWPPPLPNCRARPPCPAPHAPHHTPPPHCLPRCRAAVRSVRAPVRLVWGPPGWPCVAGVPA
jgi:hypothetical protein